MRVAAVDGGRATDDGREVRADRTKEDRAVVGERRKI